MKLTGNSSAFKYSIIPALASGLLAVLFLVVEYSGGQLDQGKSLLGLGLFLAQAIVVFWFLRRYRENNLGGYISFGKAFAISFQAFVYCGLIYSITYCLIVYYISPAILAQIIKNTERKLSETGLSDDQVAMQMKATTWMVNPLLGFAMGVFSYVFMGSIISLILAAISKKESGLMPVDDESN